LLSYGDTVLQNGGSPPFSIKKRNFNYRHGRDSQSASNFVKIDGTVAQLWRFNDFSNGGNPPSWIFKDWKFVTVRAVQNVSVGLRQSAKFCVDPPNPCRDIAIFRFIFQNGNRPPSWG